MAVGRAALLAGPTRSTPCRESVPNSIIIEVKGIPETDRGRQTREKILCAAASLIHRQGVAATSVDEVLAASRTGKSQFYHYFDSKEHLVREVLRHHANRAIEEQARTLSQLDTWEGIEAWLESILERGCTEGCPIGSLAAEMADKDEALRCDLASTFSLWQSYMARGLASLKARGELQREADPDNLAEFVFAAIQGGYLLSKTRRDPAPLRNVVRQTFHFLRSYAVS